MGAGSAALPGPVERAAPASFLVAGMCWAADALLLVLAELRLAATGDARSALVLGGLLASLVGLVALVRPLARRSRGLAALVGAVIAAALLAVLLQAAWGALALTDPGLPNPPPANTLALGGLAVAAFVAVGIGGWVVGTLPASLGALLAVHAIALVGAAAASGPLQLSLVAVLAATALAVGHRLGRDAGPDAP